MLDDACRNAVSSNDQRPARVLTENRDLYLVTLGDAELLAEVSGRFRHRFIDRERFPAVGDWVLVRERQGGEMAVIDEVLERRTALVRKQIGDRTEGQVLAANIDQVWVVSSMTKELSARRIERFLAVAFDSGADPVVVLTKADLHQSDPDRMQEVRHVALGAEVVETSAMTGEGVERLRELLGSNRTAALIGSSGVGKSTLVNHLTGSDLLLTTATRRDDVGRHTTTHRELVRLPGGGVLIDTPGLRELFAWETEGSSGFSDIEALAASCRFRDCVHKTEPGCAVRLAIDAGELDADRLRGYEKMQREAAYLERRKASKRRARR